MNNWYVITGSPCSGITTIAEALKERGMRVEYEVARIYIDEQMTLGKTLEEIRSDEENFQNIVYQKKIQREEELSSDEIIFLDRGIPDTYAYHTLHGFEISKDMDDILSSSEYKKVFYLEPFKFEKDYARTEDREQAAKLSLLLKEAYERTPNEIVTIPIFDTKEERIEYFINYLKEHEGIEL